jgi:GAF domain-containing protein
LRQEKLLLIRDTEKYGEDGFFPSWYAERIKEPLFLILIPVMVNGKAICLIHIEGKRDAFSVSEAHFNYLRILQNQAAVAIRQKAK